jgi:aryl-alcohol dehydrogenase-like predicted oxidoreductase
MAAGFLGTTRRSAGAPDADDKDPSAAQIPEAPPSTRKGDMLYRELGRTGQQVSLIGLGGFHIGQQKEEADSIRLIRSAIDRGITFLDNSWDYNEGQSEIREGKALRDGYRDKVFLMTKIDGRTKKAATEQLDESLRRLQTDHLDLLQFHEIIQMEAPDRIFNEGAAEAMMEAKKAGKFRFIGFTGHKDPLIHLRMLHMAADRGFQFDTVQMPINVMDANFRSFQHLVLPVVLREGIGALAMKTFGDHFILDDILKSGKATPIELLHYSMTMPVSVVITGIDKPEILDQAIEAARTFKPLTAEQIAALRERTRPDALTGLHEKFKTTSHFDSTAKHPEWLG